MKFVFVVIFICFEILNANSSLKKVSLQLSWYDQFQFAGYYIAKEKGFYRDVGLDVTIKPFALGIDIAHDVNTGKTNFAIGRENIMIEKSKHKNIVALYALFQSSPLVFLSKKSSNIQSLQDFASKKIMATLDDTSEVSIKSMIQSKKLDTEDISFIKHSHNINDLIEGKTDIISAYISKAPYVLEKEGIEYTLFAPQDYGFDMYSDFLYTNQQDIDTDLKQVNSFKNASLKGWEYAYNNIEEAVTLILKKYNPQKLSKEELIYEAIQLKKLSYLHSATLGNISVSKLQRIHDLYNIMGLLPEKISVNQFILRSETFYTQLTQEERNFIQNNPIIKIGEKRMLKPLSFLNSIGLNQGIHHDILTLISEKTGLRFIVDSDESENLLDKLQKNIVDSISYPISENRYEFINTKSYFTLNTSAFRKEDTLKSSVHTIGVFDYVMDSTMANLLNQSYPDAQIIYFQDIKTSLENLSSNKIDLLYVPKEMILLYIQDNNISDIVEVVSKLPLYKIPLGFIFKKDSAVLESIFSKALNDISSSQIESIKNKWIPVVLKNEIDYKFLMEFLIVFFVGVLFLAYRHFILRRMNSNLEYLVKKKTEEIYKINASLEIKIIEEVEKSKAIEKKLFHAEKINVMAEMISNIAHQWRQPLSVITTGISTLKVKAFLEQPLSNKNVLEFVEPVLIQTEYLSSTINDFGDFFAINHEEPKKYEISELFIKFQELVQRDSKNKTVQLHIIIENTINITINENAFLKAILNIFANARDAMEQKKLEDQKKHVFITIRKAYGKMEIIFKDTGGGIDTKVMKKIFEPYFTTKHPSMGTGLGLYMTYQVITKCLHGKIDVENIAFEYENIGYEGAKFEMSIPLDI